MADSTCETVFIITLYFAPEDVPKFLEMAMPTFDKNQLTKEYYKEYLAVTERMYVKPREMKILNLMGSKYSFQRS
ncbi:hypothetical protein CSOJ01_08498 [Colletotrichum sojae]|uniref:Uncharacterized protein n=1 Tax=Colletotrichum sojae TaxID=2175907 RepID=A0A8H6J5I0_9PEZI|nr:hypothetical protein CSOJ01_08498 [Colletotrichum sojae]